jgi:hypothetical protein
MAAILDVWVTKPGDPCYVDDGQWVVRVYDADGRTYHWANTNYGQLPAPQAHWVGTIPPGCYVVQAEGKDERGKPVLSDHAIVEVGCDDHACVRLFVPPGDRKQPDLDLRRFSVAPGEVKSGAAWQGHVVISGPAPAGGVDVSLASSDPAVAETPASVHVPHGAATATFNAPPTSNKTGKPVQVTITATLGATQKTAKLTVDPVSR